MKVVIAHAITATPDWSWYPAVSKTLRAAGAQVAVPQLPNAEAPRLESWLHVLARESSREPARTVLVGHSLGGVCVLRFLESREDGAEPFAGVVLVATNSTDIGFEAAREFFETPLDFSRARTQARRFASIVAVDDPVIGPEPWRHSLRFVEGLGASALLLPAGGHLGRIAGVTDLPQVSAMVIDMLESRSPAGDQAP
jgi:predicted alpha/beta hydrolase family esterase